jgi:serine/threonine-protein kinase
MKLAARLAAAVLPVAVLLGGCGSGTQGTAAPPAPTSESSPTTQSTASASPTSRSTTLPASSSVAVPKVMPDLTGMTLSAAQAALAPYNVQVKTVNKIDAQPAGSVIEQDPVAGAPFAQLVTLTVSTAPATVPDVTGKTFRDAQQQLTKAGFTVVENPIFDQQKADGLVTGQNPPAGTGNAAEVTLDVVRRPAVTYLADMQPVSVDRMNYPTNGTTKANGKSYSHGLLMTPPASGIGTVEYDFSRQYRKLSGELGLDDKSDSAAVGKVEIYGDGRQLLAQDVPFGTTTPVDLDVTDVLRIKITVASVDGTSSIVFGDFAAQGLQSEVGASGSPAPTTTSR